MRNSGLKIGILALVLALAGCGTSGGESSAPPASAAESEASVSAGAPDAPSEESGKSEGEAAALLGDFGAADLAGNAVDQTLFAGHRLTMVNVWATYCGPCIEEMPELGELGREYADRGVQIVGIVSDALAPIDEDDPKLEADPGQVELAKEIVEKTGASYTHLLPTDIPFLALLQQVRAVPTTFFLDESGVLVGDGVYEGGRDKAGWAKVVDEMLAKVA